LMFLRCFLKNELEILQISEFWLESKGNKFLYSLWGFKVL